MSPTTTGGWQPSGAKVTNFTTNTVGLDSTDAVFELIDPGFHSRNSQTNHNRVNFFQRENFSEIFFGTVENRTKDLVAQRPHLCDTKPYCPTCSLLVGPKIGSFHLELIYTLKPPFSQSHLLIFFLQMVDSFK